MAVSRDISQTKNGRFRLPAALYALCASIFFILPGAAQTPVYPIEIQNITFSGGIGRGPTSAGSDYLQDYYYRGYGLPGTTITLTASMDTGSGFTSAMHGAVQFTVTYTGGTTNSFTVTMPSGSHTATAEIPYNFTGIAPNNTGKWTYTVTASAGDYAAAVPTINLPSGCVSFIYWNDANKNAANHIDSAVPGTPQPTVTQTSTTLFWAPVDTTTTDGTHYGSDFYEYRIYYRKQGTSIYKQWNGVNDTALRGLTANPFPAPTSDAVNHFAIPSTLSVGWKYTTISSLQLFTAYEYYIVAADIFGNETPLTSAGSAAAPLGVATLPLNLQASISDGITSYSDFSTLNTSGFPPSPPLRPLRAVNTRVDIYTITTQSQPDKCVIWFAPYSATITAPLVTGTLEPNDGPAASGGLDADIDSVTAVRTGSNKWTAYLPTTPSAGKNQIIKEGTYVRFEVQLFSKGIATFVDRDSSDTATTPWDYYVGTPAVKVSYPTRILNNVLTSANPTAYPAYYLTEDAYVTIKVFDIKGRPVVTILDSAFRRGGISIKENGWDGSNKANRKIGIGLYYMHFRAKSASNGKVILDDTKKVVMKH
jgi:hypothetical protein